MEKGTVYRSLFFPTRHEMRRQKQSYIFVKEILSYQRVAAETNRTAIRQFSTQTISPNFIQSNPTDGTASCLSRTSIDPRSPGASRRIYKRYIHCYRHLTCGDMNRTYQDQMSLRLYLLYISYFFCVSYQTQRHLPGIRYFVNNVFISFFFPSRESYNGIFIINKK